MSVLGDGLRRVLGRRRRRPGTALVHVGPARALPPPAVPAWPPRALPAPQWPVCRGCGRRHPPTPYPSPWAAPLLGDLGRPVPLSRQAGVDQRALERDRFNPWRP
jgi:hypothetical protein